MTRRIPDVSIEVVDRPKLSPVEWIILCNRHDEKDARYELTLLEAEDLITTLRDVCQFVRDTRKQADDRARTAKRKKRVPPRPT
jgi:hypothetical protein